MKKLLTNGTVMTRDAACPMIEHGAVLFEDGVITAAGPAAALEQAHPDAQRIDAKGGIILPGFINTHQHIYSAFARGLTIPGNCPTDFPGVLEGTWWNIDRHLTRQMTRMSAYMTLIEGIRSGVTAVFDHHASFCEIEGSLDEIAEAATTLGVRACLCYEISDRDGPEKARQSVLENERFENYCKTDRSGLLAAMCGMHASFTISEETMAFARAHTSAGFHIHVCEGAYDRDHCSATYHETVVHRLARHGILGEQTICGHCVYLTDEDRAALADTQTAVVHNPQSNMGNAVGVTDILKLIGAGVTVGLGTDGFTADLLESVKTASVLVKHMNQHPSIGFGEVMDMAFVNNARLADRHFGGTCGVIRPGARADLIVSDYRPMTRLTGDNLNGHITFGMNGRNITTTICGGRVLMQDRVLVGVDEEKIAYECRAQADALWRALGAL